MLCLSKKTTTTASTSSTRCILTTFPNKWMFYFYSFAVILACSSSGVAFVMTPRHALSMETKLLYRMGPGEEDQEQHTFPKGPERKKEILDDLSQQHWMTQEVIEDDMSHQEEEEHYLETSVVKDDENKASHPAPQYGFDAKKEKSPPPVLLQSMVKAALTVLDASSYVVGTAFSVGLLLNLCGYDYTFQDHKFRIDSVENLRNEKMFRRASSMMMSSSSDPKTTTTPSSTFWTSHVQDYWRMNSNHKDVP